MIGIPLINGGRIAGVAIVDDADYHLVRGFKWRVHAKGYAARVDGKRTILMHRELLAAGPQDIVDHQNRDGFDNRRANLRLVTRSQNMQNTDARRGSASRFRGVSPHRASGLWRAKVQKDGIVHYLGYFRDEADAGKTVAAWRRANMPHSHLDQEGVPSVTFMEQRIWITIEGFPAAADEDRWEPFITDLEQGAHDFGPVLSWDGEHTARVVMSADVTYLAAFARTTVDLVVGSLQAAGLDELYPSAIDIQPADDPAPVAA